MERQPQSRNYPESMVGLFVQSNAQSHNTIRKAKTMVTGKISAKLRGLAWPAAVMISGLSGVAFAGPQFSEWSLPMGVPGVAGESCPMESHDGNTL